MPFRRWAPTAGCALMLAGCGASGAGTGTGTTNNRTAYSTALKFADCMRSHGVPNFPDPASGGGGGGGGIQVNAASGVKLGSPAFRSAASACRRYGGGLSGPPHHIPAATRRKLIAFSQCMRTHGVPSFPDPTFPASGGARVGGPPESFDPASPAVRRAAAACGGPFK